MAQQGHQPLETNEWEAEHLRITTFHTADFNVSELPRQWEDLFGEPPEQQTIRPREGITELAGIYAGNQFVLTAQQQRVNFLILPVAKPLTEIAQVLPTLGLFARTLESLHDISTKWLATCGPITRLAFGSVLVRQVDNVLSGHQHLAQFLPFLGTYDREAYDFLYQINRPRLSIVDPGIRLNRLTKWSIMQGGGIAFAIGPSEVKRLTSDSVMACRLELDINTTPNRANPLLREQIEPIFHELVTLGSEISEKGDIA